MIIIISFFFILLLIISVFLLGWAGFPRLSSATNNQRITRALGAGIGSILFIISAFSLYRLFSNKIPISVGSISNSLTLILNLCTAFACLVFLGAIAAVYTYYQTQYSERLLRRGLNRFSKLSSMIEDANRKKDDKES
jgi:hypothetical protein